MFKLNFLLSMKYQANLSLYLYNLNALLFASYIWIITLTSNPYRIIFTPQYLFSLANNRMHTKVKLNNDLSRKHNSFHAFHTQGFNSKTRRGKPTHSALNASESISLRQYFTPEERTDFNLVHPLLSIPLVTQMPRKNRLPRCVPKIDGSRTTHPLREMVHKKTEMDEVQGDRPRIW